MGLERKLAVMVDGVSIAEGCRVRFRGETGLSLYPDLMTVGIMNLAEQRYHLIRQGGDISVICGASLLASGKVQDVTRETRAEGVWTVIGFSMGMDLWEAVVSLAVSAGTTVSGTVKQLLEASGTGWKLLSFPGEDPVYSRGQAFFGRAAEAVETALTAAKARACLVPSGMVVVPERPEKVEVMLSEGDLADAPVFTADCVVLNTIMAGWPIGRRMELQYGGKTTNGVIVRQRFEADTGDGPWRTEMMAEVLNE